MNPATPLTTVILLFASSNAVAGQSLPSHIQNQIPSGYEVSTFATGQVGLRQFYFVALQSRTEESEAVRQAPAPSRPLLIFGGKQGRYALLGRNDHVILRRDEGGFNGCDPFEGKTIAVKGTYFTVEQGVSCGQHWTYYVTFHFNQRLGDFVFDNLRSESWSMNTSSDPTAEALVSDGQHVDRAKKRLVAFAKWRPDRR